MRSSPAPSNRRLLTYTQAANAVAENVRALGGVIPVATLIANRICDAGSGPRLQPAEFQAAKQYRDATLRNTLATNTGFVPERNLKAIKDHLFAITSPERKEAVEEWVLADWIHSRLIDHAEMLFKLSSTHPKVYEAAFGPSVNQTIELARRGNVKHAWVRDLCINQARFVLVASAHYRTRHVRQIATSPLGGLFCGIEDWKSAGHVLLTTIAEPALRIQRIYECAQTFLGTDKAVRNVLAEKKLLLNNEAGDFVHLVALEVRAILQRRQIDPGKVEAFLDQTWDPLVEAGAITRKTVRDEGLNNISLSSLWYGLEPSELSAYIAIQLLKALNAVDDLVDRALLGRKGQLVAWEPTKAAATIATTILRYESRPDRETVQMGKSRSGGDGGIDAGFNGSRKPLATMLEKISDPAIEKAVSDVFGIDPTRLFL
ncbi:hypothetical protein JW805_16040 [Roseomonas aeriglobus]|nr:hypothetical protein [Roseomonas aeriglobus]